MKTEFELKILEVDPEIMHEKLLSLGAKKVAVRDMKRRVYRLDNARWVRLRYNGEKSQLTYKDIQHAGIDGTKEVEIDVSDFDTTHELLLTMGLACDAYQENKRTSFVLDGVEIEIDEWPLIPAYLEVEGNSVEEVIAMVEKLGYAKEQTTTLNTDDVYAKYGLNIYDYPELTKGIKNTEESSTQ